MRFTIGFVFALVGSFFAIRAAVPQAPALRPHPAPRGPVPLPPAPRRPILPPGLTAEQARLYAMPCSPTAH